MEKIDYKRYFIILLILVILYVSFLLVKPFIGTLVISILLAYAFFPLYKKLDRKINSKNLSATLMTIIVIVIIVLPVFFTVNAITKEVRLSFTMAKQRIVTGNIFDINCAEADNIVCSLSEQIKEVADQPQIRYYIDESVRTGTSVLTKKISDFLLSVPRRLVDVFVMFFVLFYLFRDGRETVDKVQSLLPFKASHRKRIMRRLNNVMFALVYVYFAIAAVQGMLGGLGFLLFGLSSPILWGIVMGLFSLLPVGSVVIWGPAAIFMIVNGAVENSNFLIFKGLLLILYGALIVGLSDNIIRIKVIGAKAQIHSVLIILGVLGGLFVFGLIGTIVGPLVLALLVTLIEIYERER